MKTPTRALALVAALSALPLAAAAADPPMAPMKPPDMAATMLCRPPLPNEKPNATMNGQGIVCKTMTKMMKDGMMMVPKTTSDSDKMWADWLDQVLLIPRGGDGGG